MICFCLLCLNFVTNGKCHLAQGSADLIKPPMRLQNHGTVILDLYEAKGALLRLLLKKVFDLIWIIIELHILCLLAIINLRTL